MSAFRSVFQRSRQLVVTTGRISFSRAERACSSSSGSPETPSNPTAGINHAKARARELGIQLSPTELAYMRADGVRTEQEYMAMVSKQAMDWAERQALANYIIKGHENSVGQRLLLWLDFLGTALFAFIGSQFAGEAGMNQAGCVFVGCVASLGGGTLNNVMTNNTRGGVFWMRDTRFLAISIVSSVATFYLWPIFEDWEAAQAKLENVKSVKNGVLYGLETLAIGSVAVIGAQAGIVRGIPPIACIVTGTSICFGGILRDVLCQREVAVGSQSYAVSLAMGASVYTGLRQLVVRGWNIPLLWRIMAGMGTSIFQRIFVWKYSGGDQGADTFLQPMKSKHPRKSGDTEGTE